MPRGSTKRLCTRMSQVLYDPATCSARAAPCWIVPCRQASKRLSRHRMLGNPTFSLVLA